MRFRLPFLAVCLFVVGGHPASLFAAEDPSPLGFPASVSVLLQQIEMAHPEDIGKDSAGNVVSVVLRQGRANDANLMHVSRLDSLCELSLSPTRRAEPSERGIAPLGRLTNLVSLHIACSGPLREGVFRAVCSLKPLRHLHLTAVYPPIPEYASITNLQHLAELQVDYCTDFGDAQLTLVTNLPNLRSLVLKADGLSDQATNIVSGMGSLTNVVIKLRR